MGLPAGDPDVLCIAAGQKHSSGQAGFPFSGLGFQLQKYRVELALPVLSSSPNALNRISSEVYISTGPGLEEGNRCL